MYEARIDRSTPKTYDTMLSYELELKLFINFGSTTKNALYCKYNLSMVLSS